MKTKTLQIGNDLRETIIYNNAILPLSISIDHFDEYFCQEWTCHWHEEFEFAYVRTGRVKFTIYDSTEICPTIELQAGDGIFISAGTLHSAKALQSETILVVTVFPMNLFKTILFDRLYTQDIQPIIDSGVTHIFLKQNETANHALLQAIQTLGTLSNTEICYELHCLELICRLWRLLTIKILKSPKSVSSDLRNILQGKRVQKMMAYIHSHYAEHISVDEIAKAASISRTECFRCFRMILKRTPIEYLLEYRLTMAASLLANTDLSLSDIAESCGFNSNSYFGKMFLKQSGLSPKKYRQNAIKKRIS